MPTACLPNVYRVPTACVPDICSQSKTVLFDLTVTPICLVLDLAGYSEFSVILLIRLFRMVQLLSDGLFRMFVSALGTALQNILFIFMTFLAIVYLAGILAVWLFKANDPRNFGNVQKSMVSLLKVPLVRPHVYAPALNKRLSKVATLDS